MRDAAVVARWRVKLAWYRGSEALWKRRHTYRDRKVREWSRSQSYRYRKWKHYRHTRPEGDPLRGKWWTLYMEARAGYRKWVRLRSEASDALRHRRAQAAFAKRVIARHSKDPRRKAVEWAQAQARAHVVEHPAGSNRGGRITLWQRALGAWLVGLAWCGTFCAAALRAAGVRNVDARLASVALIEDLARAGNGPFRAWTTDASHVQPGDLVVLFGRGVHVELVVRVSGGVVHTVGGNTSSGNAGSQNNGGGVYERERPLSAVHGFALVNY